MFIVSNMNIAPYFATFLIVLNNLLFTNPLAMTKSIDIYQMYLILFKSVAVFACVLILVTKGKIHEARPDVDFGSPFKRRPNYADYRRSDSNNSRRSS